jgi:putative flippase GtrA
MLAKMSARLRRLLWARYLMASVIALAADLACFLLLVWLHLAAGAAAAIGYGLGILVHWLLSTRTVFAGGMDLEGADRLRGKALFVMSALVGLALTVTIVTLATMLGAPASLAKLLAILVSFQTTYVLRKRLVFSA